MVNLGKRCAVEKMDLLRNYFNSGATLSHAHRKKCLQQFDSLLEKHRTDFFEALQLDFNKPVFETLATELGMLQKELKYLKKHLKLWTQPERVAGTLLNFPAKEYKAYQPFGVVLIIAPWNYPLLLALQPVMAALAAGNCVVLKPSEHSAATSALLARLLPQYFDEGLVQVVEGDADVTANLLKQRFDKIFFTGSTKVGKMVYQAAAKNLTPVVLELGGKSPCIVTPNADIALAAKRIAFGKFVNAGQTCIAPDFVFIHQSVEAQFVAEMKKVVQQFYGVNPEESKDFARIINDMHYQRIKRFVLQSQVVLGGETNAKTRYIAPTLLKIHDRDAEVMNEEIFGPVLPLVNYETIDELITYNQAHPKPLAFYVFSSNKSEIQQLLQRCQYGGACINDCLSHILNSELPFGGFGESGLGNYHGRYSFEAFSQTKSVVYRNTWLDIPLKYPPYSKNKFKLLKRFFKMI